MRKTREIRERSRRWVRPATEAVLWALLGTLIVVEVFGVRDRPPLLEASALVLALAAAATLYRSFPLTALGTMLSAAVLQMTASIAQLVETSLIAPWLALLTVAFLAGLRSERVRPVITMVTVACAFTLAVYLVSAFVLGYDTRTFLSDLVDWLGGALTIVLTTLTAWLFGRYQQLHQRLTRGGWEIAERMERTRTAESDRARLRERARIATRMHDSLGHDLALIAVRAAALEMTQEDSGQRKAAGELRTAAHEANLRLREIIGVLREGTDDPAPEPLASLVQRASDSGMRIRLLREGPDPDPATPGGRAVHRVVQEALTNAAKYAPEAEVAVRVVREAGRTRVSVGDTGSSLGAGTVLPVRKEEGSGLAGLRSLVEDLGGGFEAGPSTGPDGAGEVGGTGGPARTGGAGGTDSRDVRGFTVRATVPDSVGEEGTEGGGQSETRRTHTEVRGHARRRLTAAVAVPAALGAGVLAVGFALLAWISFNTVLPAERYERLSVGDDQARVERALPRFAYPEQSVEEAPPDPPGTRCSYYLVRQENGLPPVYRLCFADGVLVSKDVIQRYE